MKNSTKLLLTALGILLVTLFMENRSLTAIMWLGIVVLVASALICENLEILYDK